MVAMATPSTPKSRQTISRISPAMLSPTETTSVSSGVKLSPMALAEARRTSYIMVMQRPAITIRIYSLESLIISSGTFRNLRNGFMASSTPMEMTIVSPRPITSAATKVL